MANRFLDSVGHYNISYLTAKYTSSFGAILITAGFGVNGESALLLPNNALLSKTLDNQSGWTAGWNEYLSGSIPSGTSVLIEWRDGGATQVNLQLLADGTLQVARAGVTVLGTTTFSLNANTHHFIEFKVTIHNTTGSAEVKVDGNTKLTLTNVNTRATANNRANEFRFRGASTRNIYNLYVNDNTGSVNNGYMASATGALQVIARFPNAAGDSNQLLQPGGVADANNYQEVDNNPPDVAHYVESGTPGDKDLYHMEPVALTGTIKAVQTGILAETTAGAISITPLIKPDAVEYSGTSSALAGSPVYILTNYDESPDTAAAWTVSELDDTQVGMEVD